MPDAWSIVPMAPSHTSTRSVSASVNSGILPPSSVPPPGPGDVVRRRRRGSGQGEVRGEPAPGAGRRARPGGGRVRSEEHTSELQSQSNLVCRLLLETKNKSASPLSPEHLHENTYHHHANYDQTKGAVESGHDHCDGHSSLVTVDYIYAEQPGLSGLR